MPTRTTDFVITASRSCESAFNSASMRYASNIAWLGKPLNALRMVGPMQFAPRRALLAQHTAVSFHDAGCFPLVCLNSATRPSRIHRLANTTIGFTVSGPMALRVIAFVH